MSIHLRQTKTIPLNSNERQNLSAMNTNLKILEDVKTYKNLENVTQDFKNSVIGINTNCKTGDFYIIGKIWIDILKSILLSANCSLVPAVKAAPPEPPKKPPRMKYTDLPLYECPHYSYKDYVEKSKKCPDADVKLLHRALHPHVRHYKQKIKTSLCDMACVVKETKKNIRSAIADRTKQFKEVMRDPDKLVMRQAVVAGSGVTGYMLGGGGGIPRRLFFTISGLLAGGALCFPKETDEIFRSATYYVGKPAVMFYNKFICGNKIVLRERLPCKEDLPPTPPPRKPVQCPPKK